MATISLRGSYEGWRARPLKKAARYKRRVNCGWCFRANPRGLPEHQAAYVSITHQTQQSFNFYYTRWGEFTMMQLHHNHARFIISGPIQSAEGSIHSPPDTPVERESSHKIPPKNPARAACARRGRGSSRGRLILLRCEMPDMGDIPQDCLISTAPASWDKPHLSNCKAFLDDDVIAECRYTGIESFNYR